MFKVFATDVVVSKGYDNSSALKFSDDGTSVRFRIGKKVYDTRAENNTRWVNVSVKAFGVLCDRIKKMQLKEGSFIHIAGRLDEDNWVDTTTNEKKSQIVIILHGPHFPLRSTLGLLLLLGQLPLGHVQREKSQSDVTVASKGWKIRLLFSHPSSTPKPWCIAQKQGQGRSSKVKVG